MRRAAEARSASARRAPAGRRTASPVRRGLARLWRFAGRHRALWCLFCGALLPLAFAPFDFYPLAVLAPLGLFLSLEGANARQSFGFGWFFGVGSFGVGVSWVYVSFQYANVGPAVAAPLTIGFVLLMALYPALAATLAVAVAPRAGRVRSVVLAPAAWVLVEWLRGWLFTGFTWLDLGYSQVGSPLAGLAPVGGVYAVSLAVALSAGLLALALHARGRASVAALLALAALWTGAGALRGVHWTEPAGPPLRTVLVQGDVPQSIKWLPEMRQPTLARYLRLTRAHWGARLVVWPETALPALASQVRPYIAALGSAARRHGADVIFGVVTSGDGGRRYYNTVEMVGADRGSYRKRHLVPFGEYLPFDRWLRPITDYLGIPVSEFSAGSPHQPPFVVDGYPIDISICYEIAFGEQIARALPRAALLVTVSDDAWFGDSIGPPQNLQIARMRALETGRWLARATNTGVSAIVAPDGAVIERAPRFAVATLSAALTPMRGATPYVRLLDWPVVALASLLLLGGAIGARRTRPDPA